MQHMDASPFRWSGRRMEVPASSRLGDGGVLLADEAG